MKKDFEIQGGVKNYLGKTEEVTAPKFWQSSPDSPKTELAYITDAEKGLLLEANLHGSLLDNKPNIGASGILSFDGFGSRDPGQNRAGGDVSRDMDRGRDDSGSKSSGGGSTTAFQGTQSNQFNTAMSESQEKQVVAQNIVDLVDQGVNINDALTGKTTFERLTGSPFFTANALKEVLSPFANAANKKRRNDFMTTQMIKEYELGTGLNWNPNGVIVEGSPEYNYLFNETDYANTISDSSNNNVVGGGGDNSNNNVVTFDNPQDFATVETNENSMVNDYFKNTNNLGISKNFLTSYDQAKSDLAKTLNMTPNTNQFGYSGNMTSSNIYFNYLKEQGLI